MILVVADTSPVRYLILVGAIEVLPKLYDAVVIPEAVLSELQHPSAPTEVRGWTAKLPGWITVRSPARFETRLRLGLGELEPIALKEELGAAAVLLDDRHARDLAQARGLHVAEPLACWSRLPPPDGSISRPPWIACVKPISARTKDSCAMRWPGRQGNWNEPSGWPHHYQRKQPTPPPRMNSLG